MALPDPPVDTRRERSVEFARPTALDPTHPTGDRPPIPVGPGRPEIAAAPASGAHRDDVSGFPVQYAKVQPPPLREETLARHRLLDWLAVKIHHRIILILADAGYGKTTLLADFAGRTRLRTLWYRMDEDDRDWISLLSHLVAAGREADPTFAPNTAAMLADTSLSGPTRDTVIEVFMREVQTIAPEGAILIIDDFHLVDDAPDAQMIARELVARAPERLSIVFASRRTPGVPMAKLRAIGEVAELTTDDLRFDESETARLFSETYGRTLEPDVLADVAARTEGWAASLQLVHAALRDRTPGEIRSFVRGLTGADHELYDYLAEEVVGDLPSDLQDFLMRTAILQVVTPEFAGVATGGLDTPAVARLTASAERLTLLSRRARGPRDELRYHPLVREFLEARLARDHGDAAVRDLHRTVALHAEDRDWRIAAHHHWLAGDRHRAYDIIDASAQSIIGRGEYLVAAPFVEQAADEFARASFEVVLSRRDFKQGDIRQAIARANAAVGMDPRSDVALANLASLSLTIGDAVASEEAAQRLATMTSDPGWLGIARGLLDMIGASLDGDVDVSIDRLRALASVQLTNGQTHFEGITYLNLAESLRATGAADEALQAAIKSVDLLEASSGAAEAATAHAIAAWAQVHLGSTDSGWRELLVALEEPNEAIHADVLLEAAQLEAFYGDVDRASDYLGEVSRSADLASVRAPVAAPIAALVEARRGHWVEAERLLAAFSLERPTGQVGHKALVLAISAHVSLGKESGAASAAISRGQVHANLQSARRWLEYCAALESVQLGPEATGQFVRQTERRGRWSLNYIAEFLAERLHLFGETERDLVLAEAKIRPPRWRPAFRLVIDSNGPATLDAARMLEVIGDVDDVPRLRRIGHKHRGRPDFELGRALARRIAVPVLVEDLGRVAIRIGDRTIDGSSVRRKVLALLCFLVSRPRFAATREEVMDALWPEFDPPDALNSLNQTVYFLRRIFEPEYKDDLSPGFVHHESDVLWLDDQLVSARSQRCIALIRTLQPVTAPSEVAMLSETYLGQFALDFAYEEWASDYRASLHSSYLQVIEKAVAADTASGHFERGIDLARRALELTPEADQIELSLLRLLRLNGSHSAAAEQYSHYATTVRETYGMEPPAFESL